MTTPPTEPHKTDALSVWCIADDKSGHRNQLLGLLKALSARVPVRTHWFNETDKESAPTKPDLILASGRPTQFTSLMVKRRYGGKLVVIGNPSLPKVFFDLCVIPKHDGVADSRRVITTHGAMNLVTPGPNGSGDKSRGLILIGGDAKYYQWSDQFVIAQLQQLKHCLPAIRWTLTTSRRTPASFIAAASALEDDHFQVVPCDQTTPDWLLKHFQSSGTIWATEDSVSMVYESLSAGAAVGILKVPRTQTGRVSRGLDQLIDEERVTTIEQLVATGKISNNQQPLQEAQRVAGFILDWLEMKRT